MSKYIFYAMEPAALLKYAEFKDKISAETLDLSPDKIKALSAQIQESRADGRELFTVDEEGTAHITVAGPLEPKADPCAIMFDIEMTTYGDIITAVRAAEADNNISKLVFHFDSPGGNVVGLFKTADEIRKVTKPTLAIIHGLCASAAFALACQCDEIQAENISCETGSIGVATEILDFTGRDKGEGIKRFILTSENAENKIPDVTTADGRAKIISRLTDLESVFVEYVAIGRDTTAENITTNFGRGGILIARDALSVGMIDSILSNPSGLVPETPDSRNATAPENLITGESEMGEITMTDEQLQKYSEDIAEKTAAKVETKMTAKIESDNKARDAETKRVAGFTALSGAYPNQETMITAEMEKEGAEATAEFAIKVQSAETSRIAAAAELKKNAGNPANPVNPDADAGNEKDESGNILAAQMGIKVGV